MKLDFRSPFFRTNRRKYNSSLSISIVLGAGLLTLLPSGCKNKAPQNLHFLMVDPTRSSVNPWKVTYAADYLITSSVSSPLLELDGNEKWSSPFCKSWGYVGNAEKWVCELAQNLHWSDGSMIDLKDIVDSLQESTKVSQANGAIKLIDKITLENGNQLTISFRRNLPNSLWALAGLDQAILDPESRLRIRTSGALHLKEGLRKTSGRFRLKSFDESGRVELEPNPYFSGTSGRATLPLEIIGNLSNDAVAKRISEGRSGDIAQLLGGSVSESEVQRLQKAGLQKFTQPAPNAITEFYFGRPGKNTLTKSERQYLLTAITLEMLEKRESGGMPAIGLESPSMLGALDIDSWKAFLKKSRKDAKKPSKVDLFVMKAFAENGIYLSAKSVLEKLQIQVNEVVYDPNEPDSVAWKRRNSNDFDLIFMYTESYSPDPDPFWRGIRALPEVPKTFFTETELDAALLEPDSQKRALLYQSFERKNVDNPYIIPLRRFGNELFVSPGIDVSAQEAFGMMVNLWAFKLPPK